MFWQFVHTVASLLMFGAAVYVLSNWRERYNSTERFGLGLAGGCGLLRISVIWENGASPFYGWAPSLMTVGIALFLFGRAWRDWHHTHNNKLQIKMANREGWGRR